jgi:hypothetical protein
MRLNWGLGAPLPDLSSLVGEDPPHESKRAVKRAARAARMEAEAETETAQTSAAAASTAATAATAAAATTKEVPVVTAAVKEAAVAATKELAAALKEKINFTTGSPALTPEGGVIVKKVAAVLIKYKEHNLPVVITGHTNCGSGCSGACKLLTLAKNRCDTIVKALQVSFLRSPDFPSAFDRGGGVVISLPRRAAGRRRAARTSSPQRATAASTHRSNPRCS